MRARMRIIALAMLCCIIVLTVQISQLHVRNPWRAWLGTTWGLLFSSSRSSSAGGAGMPGSERPRKCAAFFVYGGIARYETEVMRTMERLKQLNPIVRTILVTDNLNLANDKNASETMGRRYPQLDSLHLIARPEKKSWLPRLEFISKTMDMKFRDCDVTIALDSHVTVCSGNLGQKLDAFHADKANVLGANVEHAPQIYASPFRYFLQDCGGEYGPRCHKYLPHNFAIVFRGGSQRTRNITNAWWNKMRGSNGDDQVSLMKAIESKKFAFTPLSESFAFAFKSVHKGRLGFWPRFT